MIPEPVQRAIRKIDGLLARDGGSAGVRAVLGRVREQLARVGGESMEVEMALLEAAHAELEACLGLIRGSHDVTDRTLEDDVTKMHRRIGRLVRPSEAPAAPAVPAAGAAPAVPAAGGIPVVPAAGHEAAGHAPSAPEPPMALPVDPWSAMAGATTAIPMLPDARPLAPIVPLARRIEIARPSPPPEIPLPPVSPPRVPASASPWQPSPPLVVPAVGAPLAPAAPLETPDDSRFVEALAERLALACRRRANALRDPLLTWAALADLDSALARPRESLGWLGEQAEAVRTAVVAEEGAEAGRWLSADDASVEPSQAEWLAALDDSDDAVAVRAALALAWSGAFDLAPSLLARAQAAPPARRGALIFAATALGSIPALDHARLQIESTEDFDHHVIEALAIAGDDSDARLLLRRATADDPNAATAALAIGHLGSAAVTEELAARGAVDDRILARALRCTFGDLSPDRHPPPAGRLLLGKPWSVAAALARLTAPDEPVWSRQRLALDLVVRTGVVPPVRYDARASTEQQRRAADALAAALARASHLAAGRWLHLGAAVPPPLGRR